MIEKNIVDRVPTKPGQIKLTPVSGAPDLFTMERADEPTVEGTPIDKATLDSIIQSRLTGRYYEPIAERKILSSQTGVAANPIPTSSWVYQTGGKIGHSGSWGVESSSVLGAGYNPGNMFDGNEGTMWQSATESTSWVALSIGAAFKISKFRLNLADHGKFNTLQMQGSNNGATWDTLIGLTPGNYEYTLPNPKDYTYYRLYFVSSSAVNTSIYEWQITEYSTTTATNAFDISQGLPKDFYLLQRLTIQTRGNFDTVGVVSNTLNGLPVKTILQPNRRYELVWSGADFTVKEV